jgi:hypothetical protein
MSDEPVELIVGPPAVVRLTRTPLAYTLRARTGSGTVPRRRKTRVAKRMKRALGGAAVLAGLLGSGAGAASAEPLERERYSFQESDTFTDTECGAPITIDYVAEFFGLFMLKEGRAGDPTPYLFDNYSGVEIYTNVANGKTFTLIHRGLFKDLRIELVEGTVYRFTAIETGQPVFGIGPDGKRFPIDRGRIRYTFFVDTQGDADLDNDLFLGFEEPDVAGPHPVFVGDADFCDLLDALR